MQAMQEGEEMKTGSVPEHIKFCPQCGSQYLTDDEWQKCCSMKCLQDYMAYSKTNAEDPCISIPRSGRGELRETSLRQRASELVYSFANRMGNGSAGWIDLETDIAALLRTVEREAMERAAKLALRFGEDRLAEDIRELSGDSTS